jgi:hypothetical protein
MDEVESFICIYGIGKRALHWYVGIINWRILNGVGRPLLWESILLVKAGEDEGGRLSCIYLKGGCGCLSKEDAIR